MNKQLIGVIRIAAFLVLAYVFNVPMEPDAIRYEVSDFFHGEHTADFRNSAQVTISMLLILAVVGFYIFQSFFYIFIGGALQNHRTGIFSFFKHLFAGIREAGSDKYFWTSDSQNSNMNNLDKILSYRDNKMALMTNSEAAKVMAKTSHIDMLLSRPDLKQSQKALSYLNRKVSLMDNASALKFIQGQK